LFYLHRCKKQTIYGIGVLICEISTTLGKDIDLSFWMGLLYPAGITYDKTDVM
jgi:hypothetical protein